MATFWDVDGTRIRSAAALGRTLRAARKSTGYSQADLAARSRADRFAVANLESGRETRAVRLIFDVLAALGLELVVRRRKGEADGT